MINVFNIQRAGVFQEEIDISITSQPAQVLFNKLIIGFSRTGTDFNTPILISNSNQATSQFGEIDRFLEKKKCFFHRAIQRGLKTGSVYALNLLYTNENDVLEYQSLSTASNTQNRAKATDEYGKFFDRTSFWTKSTEALNTVANTNVTNQDKFLHITNFSDKKRTVFMYKSSITGFDVKASEWYGSITKVPTYIHPDSYMSEYFVTVLIVDGDWTNYTALSLDPEWGSYFSTKGLTVSKLQDFINNPKVVVKGLFDTSLLPFFRDKNGRNYYIETVLNANTSQTGIFCSVDTELLESDYPKGMIDLIGNNLATDTDDLTINFLSYNENIAENVAYQRVNGDGIGKAFTLGNSIGSIGVVGTGNQTQTNYAINYAFNSANISLTRALTTDPTTFTVAQKAYILDGVEYITTSASFSIDAPVSDEYWVLYVDSDGVMKCAKDDSGVTPKGGMTLPSFLTDTNVLIFCYLYIPSASNASAIYTVFYNPASAGTAFDIDGSEYYGVTSSSVTTQDITIEFKNSNTSILSSGNPEDSKYLVTMQRKMYDEIKNNVRNNVKSAIVDSNGAYLYINDGTASVVFTDASTSTNASLAITTTVSGVDIASNTTISKEFSLIYNNEVFVFGIEGLESKEVSSSEFNNTNDLTAYGEISKYSQFYTDYINGIISEGDYFYQNILYRKDGTTLTFTPKVGLTPATIVTGVAGFYTGYATTKIKVVGTDFNDGEYVVTSVTGNTITLDITEDLVAESTFAETEQYIVDANIIYYLDFRLVNGKLTVDLKSDKALTSDTALTDANSVNAKGLLLFSEKSNYIQTVDIETVLAPNEIVIDSSRYGSDLNVGDYLLAYYDEDALVAVDEMPRKITKILEKKQYKINNVVQANKAVIKTDKEILINADNQTKRLTPIYNYVTGYKGLMLSGFKPSSWSIPDGTEDKFNQIMSVIAKDTPLYNALVNRNLISWRYLVDCWGGGLVNASKQVFVDLCGKRKTAVGLLNMPSIAEFKKSTDPSFVDANGFVNMEFVRDGADLSKNPSDRYTFGSGDGQSYVGYFTPNLIINDEGRALSIPPALEVQNTFVRKHTTNRSGVFGWTITAGSEDGLILDIVDIERHYSSESELVALNTMGANHITFTKGIGFYIDNDNTAQQAIKSALSVLHIREALIELEIELYNMLVRYNWKFNTPEVRDEIKRKADAICQRYQDDSAIYDFRNIIDESNNTPDVIDNESGILDTYVEPVRGLKIILNRITIFRTGQIQSSGF